jgi:archaellin
MDSEHIKASHFNVENAIPDIKVIPNIDTGSSKVDISKVVVKRMSEKNSVFFRIYYSPLKSLQFLNFPPHFFRLV